MTGSVRKYWVQIVKAPWWPVIPLLLVQMLSGIVYMPQNSFFPIYLEERLSFTTIQISTLIAAGQISGTFAGIGAGFLSDVLGSKWMLAAGVAGIALTSLAFVIPLPAPVAALWIVSGIAIGFHTLGGQSYLTRAADPVYLGLFSALYELSLTIGGAAGSAGLGVLLDRQGFVVFGLVLVSLSALTTVGVILFVPEARSAQKVRTEGERDSWRDALKVFRRPAVPILVVLRFLPTIFYGMGTMLMPLMINHLAGSKTSVALYGFVSLILASTSQLIAGRAADRWGPRWPTLICSGLIVLSAGGLWAFSSQLWGVFVFGVIGYATAWALAALMVCLVSVSMPSEEYGSVLGLLHGSWTVGMVVGSLLGGWLTRIATGLPFLVAGLLNVGSLGLTVLFFRKFARIPGSEEATTSGEPGDAELDLSVSL